MNRKLAPLTIAFALLFSLSTAAFAATPLQPHWVGTWASAVTRQGEKDTNNYGNTTVRDFVRVSLGGNLIRLRLSNEYGATSLLLGGVHVALNGGGGKIKPETDHAVTFGGQPTVFIPPGAFVLSDPIAMSVPPLGELAVSIFLPEQTMPVLTFHALGNATTYHGKGNGLSAVELDTPTRSASWMLLCGVDVDAPGAAAVVTLGDSITDGAHSTANKDQRWPDILANRLHADKATQNIAVLNEGISGNRILHDGTGPAALARFDRDVLGQSGVKYLIILEGINDIGHTMAPRNAEDNTNAQQIIWGLQQLVTRAHIHGIKVYGATLTPYVGAKYQDANGEQMRETVNQWIRTSGAFDAVIDFEKVTKDPAHPDQFLPAYESGDHLHPSDSGYSAMGDSINLSLFR
jgi:lysophospholipase L1-like esterase